MANDPEFTSGKTVVRRLGAATCSTHAHAP
jgi:hypothetical protein